jgi:hypothetical protein
MRVALIVVVACAAGLVGGLAVTLLKPPAALEAGSGGASDRLGARLTDLEVALARVEARVRTLEVAPPMAAPAARSGAADGPEDGSGASAATDGSPSGSEPELDERILSVIAEKERVQREEQRKRFEEMTAQRDKAFQERLGAEFGLTPWQAEQVGAILAKRRESFVAIRDRLFGDGQPDPARREAMQMEFQKIRDDAEKELQAILTPEQFETVEKAISEQYGPGWMGGPGIGPPPRGR